MAPLSRILALGALLRMSSAVLVALDSPCSVKCGNVLDSTPTDDIACTVNDYDSTPQGTIFKGCIECEATSTFKTNANSNPPATTDLQAMLCRCNLGEVQSGPGPEQFEMLDDG